MTVCRSRVAAERVAQGPLSAESIERATLVPALADDDRRAPWIEPVMGDLRWREHVWGSIAALYGRYPRALAPLREGWWNDSAQLETLCVLAVWRDWIDAATDDPRHELAFQAQLTDFSLQLRQEAGGVGSAWKPDGPPTEWLE